MRKFYIVYKNDEMTTIEGKVDCSDEDFEKWFITPVKDKIYSYNLSKEVINQKSTIDFLLEEL